jgi:hypothetical protein
MGTTFRSGGEGHVHDDFLSGRFGDTVIRFPKAALCGLPHIAQNKYFHHLI